MTRTVGACNWWNGIVTTHNKSCIIIIIVRGHHFTWRMGGGGEEIEINGELKNCSGTRVNVQ